MKPARQTKSMRFRSSTACRARSNAWRSLPKARWSTTSVRDPGRARASKAVGVGDVGEHQRDRCRIARSSAASISACMLEPRPEIRTRALLHAAEALIADASPGAAITSRSAPRSRPRGTDARRVGLVGCGDHHHADAAIERAHHLCSAIPPVSASQRTPAASKRSRSIRRRPSGSTRGMFSVSPPPVMCASAFTPPFRGSRPGTSSHRCASARAAPRPTSAGSNGPGASQAIRTAPPPCAPANSRWSARRTRRGRG